MSDPFSCAFCGDSDEDILMNVTLFKEYKEALVALFIQSRYFYSEDKICPRCWNDICEHMKVAVPARNEVLFRKFDLEES